MIHRIRLHWPLLLIGLALALIGAAACQQDREQPDLRVRERVHFPRGEEALAAGDYEAAIAAFRSSIESVPGDPRPYRWLIESYLRKGDLGSVEPILQAMLAGDQQNACVHYALAYLALKRRDIAAALAEVEEAIAIDPGLGHAHQFLGNIHYFAGRPTEALSAWQRSRVIFRNEGSREDEAVSLNNMALIHRELNDLRKALEEFEDALAIHRLTGNRVAQPLILGNMALVLADLGDLLRAMATLREALVLSREVGDPEHECWILTSLSFVYNLAGEYRHGIAYADSAIALARRIPDPATEVAGLVNRGMAHIYMGDPVSALEVCRRASVLADSLADERHRASAVVAMAHAYLDLGDLGNARAGFASSDSLFRRIGVEYASWETLLGLCEVAVREGDTTGAMLQAERTLDVCVRAGHAEGEELVALMLARLAMKRGELTRARDLTSRVIELSRRDGRRPRQAVALARRAEVLLAMGDLPGAREDARQSQVIAREIQSPEVAWQSEMVLGDVLRRLDPELAVEHYETAMEAVESVHGRLRLEEFKASYLESRIGLYFKAAELLARLGRSAEGLNVCERSRARAFRDVLATIPTQLDPRAPEHLFLRSRALEESLRTLQATLTSISSAADSDPARRRALEGTLARTKMQWVEVRREILLNDPRYGAVMPGADLPDARSLLGQLSPHEVLLEYFLGADTSLCFVAWEEEIRAVRLPVGISNLAAEIEELRRPLLAPWSLGTLSFDVALAERLREQILDPLEPFLRDATRLIIVPDGPLHNLPFETLILDSGVSAETDTLYGTFRAFEFVGDRWAIVYLPSSCLLAPLPVQPPERGSPTSRRGLLAFGNPMVAHDRSTGSDSRELIYSEREVRAITQLFTDAVLCIGDAATEVRFKQLAPAFRYVHISSHGLVDEATPLWSGLRLTRDQDGREDGFLHAHEVLSLRLRCDLVTLSACETGLGRLYAGEGLIGLTRSFLHAGAHQVLVSLWSVNDASTAMLMERFYANLNEGLAACEALQEAKVALRRMTAVGPAGQPVALAHPFFWAPFVLVGAPWAS